MSANGKPHMGKTSNDEVIELFSIVMPAYNEQDVIESTLQGITSYLDTQGFNYELIVVNDGSSDQTEDLLKKFTATHDSVRYLNNEGSNGYGYAIRKGLENYKGDAVVIVTSDGADSPKDIAAYFEKINEGYDCVFGNRFMPETSVTGYPRFKLFVNRVANRIVGWLLRCKYNDYTNGFKCYRRHVIDAMQPLVAGQFNITIELSVSAVLAGWNYAVVPNDWTQRDAGDSSFKLGRLVKPYAMTLIYCLTRHHLSKTRR